MKQLTYKATVDGDTLVVRWAGRGFETTDPTEALLDDPPRCAGAAGAHAWCAVVAVWRRREDARLRWQKELVREIVGDARRRWKVAAEAQQRHPIHVFQDAATRVAEEHYPPPVRRSTTDAVPAALRGAVRPPVPGRRRI